MYIAGGTQAVGLRCTLGLCTVIRACLNGSFTWLVKNSCHGINVWVLLVVVLLLQGKPTGREWDLNRPDAKRLDVPARLGDDDPRCGPSSLQKFAGEDITVRGSCMQQ